MMAGKPRYGKRMTTPVTIVLTEEQRNWVASQVASERGIGAPCSIAEVVRSCINAAMRDPTWHETRCAKQRESNAG